MRNRIKPLSDGRPASRVEGLLPGCDSDSFHGSFVAWPPQTLTHLPPLSPILQDAGGATFDTWTGMVEGALLLLSVVTFLGEHAGAADPVEMDR
jgi:hypothetical protein